MKKTTVYLPDELKRRIRTAARRRNRSEAEVIRAALEQATAEEGAPEPRVPLTGQPLGNRKVAARADDFLDDGFGQ